MRRPSKRPPAKKRYDAKRPVVAVRVSREQNEKLEKKDRIYLKGYKEGFAKAKVKYTVHLFCDECGEPIPIHGTKAELVVSHAVSQSFSVYHKNCQPTKAEGKRLIFDKDDNELWIEETQNPSKMPNLVQHR